jgi:hypothetical protein
LEDRIEGDQAGAVIGVSAGKIIPHDHHGDASGDADEDESYHVCGMAAQKYHREREHHNRSDDPVLDERQPKNPPGAECSS